MSEPVTEQPVAGELEKKADEESTEKNDTTGDVAVGACECCAGCCECLLCLLECFDLCKDCSFD